ncbi:MAG: hypothetical protein R8K47_03890 [Mariprofundaceae bacterium]
MPDIGFLELLLIGLIAFLALGPERMPEFFGQIGAFVRKARLWAAQARGELDRELSAMRIQADDEGTGEKPSTDQGGKRPAP